MPSENDPIELQICWAVEEHNACNRCSFVLHSERNTTKRVQQQAARDATGSRDAVASKFTTSVSALESGSAAHIKYLRPLVWGAKLSSSAGRLGL
jgi:hypothetical protein